MSERPDGTKKTFESTGEHKNSDQITLHTGVQNGTRRGWLKNGNPPGDPSKAPRCGAKTRSGQPCRAPAMRNPQTGRQTRCKLHGGRATGPRTAEGLEKCRKSNWIHGRRSQEYIAQRRARRLEFQMFRL